MSRRITVSFDREIFWAQRRGGVSRYFVELARQFAEHPALGVETHLSAGRTINEHLHDLDPARHPLVRHVPTVFPLRPIANRAMRRAGRRAPEDWAGSDILHHTHFAPEVVARTPGAVRVITVHDMIPALMPDLPQAQTQAHRMRQAVQAADAVICVSHSTKSDLMRLWGESVEVPIIVVRHGVGEEFSPHGPRLALPAPYVMYVGTRGGYKDFDTFLRACATPEFRLEGIGLLCVGGGPFTSSEKRRIVDLGLAEAVEQRDLSSPDLPSAYRGALAYVCPSRYEGFGLPVLEALACGCPVVVADTPALREIGGEAVLSYPPGDAEALLAQLTEVLRSGDSQTDARSQRGVERAATFTWHAAARDTSEVYACVLGTGESNA